MHDRLSRTPDPGSLGLYVCTYSIGRFAFQVVAEREPGPFTLSPVAGFEHMAVPFWPRLLGY